MTQAPFRYCSAPWTTAVYRVDGALLPCERNHTPYGPWQNGAATASWNGPVAQYFRREIARGRFPNEMCERCYANHNQARFESVAGAALRVHLPIVRNIEGIEADKIIQLEPILLQVPAIDWAQRTYIKDAVSELTRGLRLPGGLNRSARLSIEKVTAICEAALAFFHGLEFVERAPLARLVNLISICNARCIQCPFLFTGEIIEGYPAGPDTRIRELGGEFLADVFTDTQNITNFFMYGSEFLLYRHWKEVAAALNSGGVRLSISTNGMTLNQKNADYLIANEVFAFLNISVDGSTKETIEAIRQNVRYDMFCRNVDYFFDRIENAPRFFHNISFSFCLMTDNYHELPDFLDFVLRLRGDRKQKFTLQIHGLAPLEFAGPDYRTFVEEHHHTRIDRDVLIKSLEQIAVVAEQNDIVVGLFYEWRLPDFLAKGCPFPALI